MLSIKMLRTFTSFLANVEADYRSSQAEKILPENYLHLLFSFSFSFSSVQFSLYILNSTTYNSKILTIHTKRTRLQRYKKCYRKINTLDRKLIQYTNTNRGKNELHAGNYLRRSPSIGKLIEEGAPPS